MLQKVQIKTNIENPCKVEVLVDGVNINNRIYEYTLIQKACNLPVLEVRTNSVMLDFDGDAIVIDKTAHEEIKRLKENIKVLSEDLREYREKYGE